MATREEVLARYRQLRAIQQTLQSEAVTFISGPAITRSAKGLGLLVDDTIVTESDEELTLVFDFALFTAQAGRSRAVDRYLRTKRPSAGSDDALVLTALCRPDFSLWRIERPHEAAGLVLFDLLRERETWLVDESLEASAPEGMIFAARLLAPEDFHMTTGVIVPIDELSFLDLASDSRAWRRDTPDEVAEDPRFIGAVYRAAVDNRTMATIRFR